MTRLHTSSIAWLCSAAVLAGCNASHVDKSGAQRSTAPLSLTMFVTDADAPEATYFAEG